MKKAVNILFLTALSAFVLLVLLLTWLGRGATANQYENRSLQTLEAPTKAQLLDGGAVTALDDWATDHVKGRTLLLKTLTALRLRLLHLPVVSDVVVTQSCLLGFNEYGRWDLSAVPTQAAAAADEAAALARQLENWGGALYYVGVPEQYSYFSDRYPSYLENRAWLHDATWSAMDAAFQQAGIPFLNMRACYAELGNPPACYSATDHHYTLYGALLLAQRLMETVNAGRTQPLWVPSPETMEITELDGRYMGSRARRLYGLVDYGERAAIALPKQEVPFTRLDSGAPSAPTVYQLPEDGETLTYSLYMGGDYGETILRTDRPELPRALIIGESFTNAVECLLYPAFDELRSLDLRYYDEMSLARYLDEYRPDYVFLIRDDTIFLQPLS